MDSEWLRLILAVLATWRMSRLVAFEDGPWDAVARLRRLAGDGMLGRLMDCPYCLSLWFAAPAALSLDQAMPGWLLTWLGVSGGASLIERVVRSGDDVVIPQVASVAGPTSRPDRPTPVSLPTIHQRLAAPLTDARRNLDVLLREPARGGAPCSDNVRPHDGHLVPLD
jgi:hypothetical protein